jgi:hypothetical protein
MAMVFIHLLYEQNRIKLQFESICNTWTEYFFDGTQNRPFKSNLINLVVEKRRFVLRRLSKKKLGSYKEISLKDTKACKGSLANIHGFHAQ